MRRLTPFLFSLAFTVACGGSADEFDGELLAFADDFPYSTTKVFGTGHMGGNADWLQVSGATPSSTYTVALDLSPNGGDDLYFTVVKDPDAFGPESEYCIGLAQESDNGPSCSFVAEDSMFYMYVMRGFVEDETVTEVPYVLSVASSP